MGLIDAYTSQPHYADHIQSIWDSICERGTWYAPRTEWTRGGGYTTTIPARLGLTLVAGHADAMVVVKRGGTPILLEHGAGQTYIGHHGYRHPSNPGGDLREQIGMFLCTNEATARANRGRYPSIPCEVVGSPRLDVLRELRAQRHERLPGDPMLGMTWHWPCRICPESNWAFPEWAEAMRHLKWPGEIVGSCHPRGWKNAERWYRRIGMWVEPSWAEMVGCCDVISVDNSSVMFEAAALGIPVVVVNSARYRQEVEHGLRFWTYADIGPNVWPFDYDSNEEMGAAWSDSCKRAEGYAGRMALRIADMAATVYPYQGEAAQRAADAIVRFCDDHG